MIVPQIARVLDQLAPVIAELDRAVAEKAEKRSDARRLMEQPGVGPVTALMFVFTIGPAERFRSSKQVVSYLGLNPRESSSGGRQKLAPHMILSCEHRALDKFQSMTEPILRVPTAEHIIGVQACLRSVSGSIS